MLARELCNEDVESPFSEVLKTTKLMCGKGSLGIFDLVSEAQID